MSAGTIERILDAAELRIRRGGYHAVSFRDLASDVGIKSASVHYHYAQKADLGVAVVRRYAGRFMLALEAATPDDAGFDDRVRSLARAYRRALVDDQALCLCGMLGAESAGLPAAVVSAVQEFFESQVDWLSAGLGRRGSTRRRRARCIAAIATLQGAMMMAITAGDSVGFDEVASVLIG